MGKNLGFEPALSHGRGAALQAAYNSIMWMTVYNDNSAELLSLCTYLAIIVCMNIMIIVCTCAQHHIN